MGFVYKDITVEQRVQVGLVATLYEGSYGLITDLAHQLGTSRKFVYELRDRVAVAVEEALAPRSPGPPPASQTLLIDRRRLDRAIVALALVGHTSERDIAECLDLLYEVEPSLGYINGVLQQASQRAEKFNEGLRLQLPQAQVEADELFSGQRAHLVAVDHRSLLLLALKQAEHGDAAAWQSELEKLQTRG